MKIHMFSDTGTVLDAFDPTSLRVAQDGTPVEYGDIIIVNLEKVIAVAAPTPFAVTDNFGDLFALPASSPVPGEITKAYGPQILRAMGQANLRCWAVHPMIKALVKPVEKRLTCCCCGSYTDGRQWHNRDEGYGLCNDCIDTCVSDPLDFLAPGCAYGIPGIHYDVTGRHWRSKNRD